MPSPLILGIDGGGTKTTAWLAPLDDPMNTIVLGRGQSGPGNPRAAGFVVAQANIALAVQYAFDDAKISRVPVVAACFGLAGAGRPVEQKRIAKWAKEFGIASRVQVTGDAEPILAAAAPDNTGIALICGTGSLAWGRNASGQTARSGGWGYLLGDEGSAYAIALAGLRAAARAADGRGMQTALLPAFMQHLAADSPPDLVSKIYAPEMTRERLAGLASIVFDVRSTDKVAEQIVTAAAADLAELVANVAKQLRLPPRGYTLALAGGVLQGQLNYVDTFTAALPIELCRLNGPTPSHWITVSEPVQGAVALARILAASKVA
jgi:N-acetylglucosamine kinase-like BadF-type ATPase